MAGDEGASSSGNTSSYNGEMQAEAMPRVATHGKRGINTNLDMLKINDLEVYARRLFTTVPGDGEASALQMFELYVDSLPEGDRWIPPLHGDDVESLSDDLVMELDEQRHNYSGFKGILEARGCRCPSLEEDFLPCFKDEEELQHPKIRRDKYGGIKEQQAPEQSGRASQANKLSPFSTSVFHILEFKGHLVRPRTEELEKCLDLLPERLDGIEWKSEFKSYHDEAVGAVKDSEWETACECYEACLLLLQLKAVEESISTNIQTWLLLWVSIPLAYLYQVRLGKYPRCVTLYDQLLQQLNRTVESMDDDTNLIELYYSIIWYRRMVLFQWSYTFEETEDQRQIAQYMRSRAFNEVRVVENSEHFLGFVQLQRMINYWGLRNQWGLESDMRVALCSNLEHLYRKCKQWSEAMKWMREKWRWIYAYSDVSHELNVRWRIDDAESLFLAGRIEEAQRMMAVLEEYENTLPQGVRYRIRCLKASLLRDSNPIEANKQFQALRAVLERKINLSDDDSDLLVLVKLEISQLNYHHLKGATILERAPFGVEEGKEWDDDLDTTAIDLLNEIGPKLVPEGVEKDYKFYYHQGKHLLQSIWSRPFKAKDIEEYRNRLCEAENHFQKCLQLMQQVEDTIRFRDEVFDHEVELDTFHNTGEYRVLCLASLGWCSLHASTLKSPGDKYNVEDLRKEMSPSVEIEFERLKEADRHFQTALKALAFSCNYDRCAPVMYRALGVVHFHWAERYFEWLKDFKDSLPRFRAHFTEQNGNKYAEVDLCARKNCDNMYHEHWYFLILLKDRICFAYVQFLRIPDSSPSSSNSSPAPNSSKPFELVNVAEIRGNWRNTDVANQCLTDELLERALKLSLTALVKQTVGIIKESTDYFERGLEMHNVRTPSDRAEEQNQLVPHFRILEASKKTFTYLQRLIIWVVAIKDMIGEDVTLQAILSFKADPATAEFLQTERGAFTRKALLYAERGRSRSLVQQLLANKVLDKPIHSMVNSSMTNDQEEWNLLKNVRLSCGESTVFVVYTFDATHEFRSDVEFDHRIVTWIVYVVTKDDEVHMHSYEAKNLSKISTSLKSLNQNLSKGAKDTDEVKKALMEFYDVLIKPISGLLGDMDPADKLVIAADEVLTNVPFSVLLNAETGKFLFENHTIAFTPSLRILEHCHNRLKILQAPNLKVEPSVALGDPAYFYDEERLKRSYFEVWSIGSLFEPGSVKVLTGTEATVGNLVRLSEMPADTVQGFIHVAAHNHVNKDHKAGSLQLAHPSVEHQGPPTAEFEEAANEIMKLGSDYAALVEDVRGSMRRAGKGSVEEQKDVEERQARQQARQQKAKEAAEVKAEQRKKSYLPYERIAQCGSEWRSCMVVLSACNSAKGYVLGSEGVVGLPRAFLLNGVPCIVASQWELEDKSSSDLMIEFFKEISQGTSDASSALRTAMLRMMKREVGSSSEPTVDHVYKWGGYLVWGLPTVTLPPSVIKKIDKERDTS